MTALLERRRLVVTGVVQGVGFRPFVHRLAASLAVTGLVGNDAASVFVEVQGPSAAVAEFAVRLATDAPPLARVGSVTGSPLPVADGEDGFRIVASALVPGPRTLVPPDVATCDACLAELLDPTDRRYRHPFITCTDCGPRLTIIRDLPYDRPATTMAGFAMCEHCSREYHDPADRRFHAQPIACHHCGPQLRFSSAGATVEGSDAALAAAQQALADGLIVAVKGIGGYHLACRADSADAVARLRARKARAGKPFALLARDLDTARTLACVEAGECAALTGPAHPIVLLRRRDDAPVAEEVAPGNPLLGVLLPYTPVHHLLLAPVPGSEVTPPAVLVLTSANLGDEPLCFDDTDAAQRLPLLADAVLTHDRPIHVPVDDSVVRVIDGRELPIRRSRGYAPLPVALGRQLPPTLAVGAELKNTCCLIDGANAFCSAHVGDMGNLETLRAFERTAGQLTTLHRVTPALLAADLHPGYLTHSWAQRHTGCAGEPELRLVQHHHAHVVSLLAESGRLGEPVVGVAFDGTGYGTDAAVWGGEILLVGADPSRVQRVGHLRPVLLPGGDAAVRNPCRMALAYLADAGEPWADIPAVAASTDEERALLSSQLSSGTGTVTCTSIGRLFDAVASVLGVRHRIDYEAQAAIELEILAESTTAVEELGLPVDDGVLDHRPLFRQLVAAQRGGADVAALARGFHVTLARAVAETVERAGRQHGVAVAGLTGGVFQNVLLTRLCRAQLQRRGFEVLTHQLVPPNDGGLALGQAVVAAWTAEGSAQPCA